MRRLCSAQPFLAVGAGATAAHVVLHNSGGLPGMAKMAAKTYFWRGCRVFGNGQ
jgi:hypothetical protein